MDKEELPRKVGDTLTLIQVVNRNKSIDSSLYRGTFDEKLKIDVFIKRFDSTKMKADKDRAAHLHHENIIRYYFHDQIDNDFYYIVTEWCILSVEDLFETDDENEVIREEILESLSSKDILRQTAQGLNFLHTSDFVHRNIKPSNVLITRDKQNAANFVVKLSDFRNCKNLLNESEDSGGKESGGWIAPKRDGDKSHPSEDIFILGCFFYYVLHPKHQHPFGNKIITRTMNVYKKDYQVYRSDWNHGLDQSQAIALIKEMIKFNPTERPALKTILGRAYFLPDDYYKLYDVPGVTPGLCVIFNQENFIDKPSDGSEKDNEALTTIFEDFGFDVKSYDDLSSTEIENEIKHLATKDYANYGCLVVCILSHGNEGTICGSDGGQVSIEDLKNEFYGNKSLDGKPKIWINQAEQGGQLEKFFRSYPTIDAKKQEIDQDTNVDQPITASNSDADISRPPPISDFLDIRATVPGGKAFRNQEKGSLLIQHLCQQLRTAFVDRVQPHRHLEDLLKTVQKIISEEIRWIPIEKGEEVGPRKGTFQPFYNKKHEKVLCKPCKQTIEWRSTLIDFIRFEKIETEIMSEIKNKDHQSQVATSKREKVGDYLHSLIAMFEPNNQKLSFLLCDDEKPTNSHQVSEIDLFRYLIKNNEDPISNDLLREIEPNSKIRDSHVETHRQRPNTISHSHIFVVFQTCSERGEFWWSIDRHLNEVIVQRSREKDEITKKFKGKTREGTELIDGGLEGKGTIRDLLTILWIYILVDIKYQRNLSRCESIIPLIMKKITKIRYEYKSDFIYSALSSEERNPDLLDVVDLLSNVSNWHPLVVATRTGDIEEFNKLQKQRNYNINGIYNKFTLLNLAILFDKREMIRHLQEQIKVDPRRRDERGRNALDMAAKFIREPEIVISLLNKIQIDQCDATGTTALNHAIMASNTAIVRCLLDNGADPKKFDRNGRSSLHVAASFATDTDIVNLLLQNPKVNINEVNKLCVTALHNAATTSNVTMARHLLKKGADINRRDQRGLTPLHVAAFSAKGMDMINLFLNNEEVNLHSCDELGQNVIAYAKKNTYGLRKQIECRLNERDSGIIREYNLLKQAKYELQISIWKKFFAMIPLASLIDRSQSSKDNQLFFIPFADLKPGKGCEISESALIQFIANEENVKQLNLHESEKFTILSDIDHQSKITRIQIYQSSINKMANLMGAFHFFIVFQTANKNDEEFWWSIEKKMNFIVLQRSREKDAVSTKFEGKERKDVTSTVRNGKGIRSIKDLFTSVWTYQVMQEKYPNKYSNCPSSFVNFVSERIATIDPEANPTDESDRNPVVSDLIQILSSGICKWPPLLLSICLGNAELFDRIKEAANFDHINELTPLNLAIALPNKTELVRHLLENQNADPTLRDGSGKNALEMAAIHADNAELINLIAKKRKGGH